MVYAVREGQERQLLVTDVSAFDIFVILLCVCFA